MGLIDKLPINQRPREKAFLYGINSLTTAELLAVLLCTGNREKDVLELSQLLLNQTGTLKNLDALSLQELSSIKGIKKAKALKIKAALELHHRIEKEKIGCLGKISSLEEAAVFFVNQDYDKFVENLQILLLDSQNNLIATKIISIGTSNSVMFSIKDLISFAIKGKAKKIIIAHNHPSNNIIPSSYDIEETEKISLLSSVLGIEFIDHLILGNEKFYSFSLKEESFYQLQK